MVTKVKGGVLDESALSGKNMTGDIAFDTTTLKIDSSNNRVGIGTASPDSPLEIDGGSSVNTVLHLTSTAANTYLKISDSNTNEGNFIGCTTNDLTFFTRNTERFRVDSTGNLLLGATSSNAGGFGSVSPQLLVAGTMPQVALHETDTDKDGYIGISGSTMFIQTADAIPMRFGTSDTERARIDSAGRFAIGVNNPADYYATNLVVQGASEGGITIASTSTQVWNYIMFADGTSGDARYRGYIGYNHNNDRMAIAAGGSERIQIDSDGLKFGSDTAAANALDDYEEGSWTARITSSTGTALGTQNCTYTKIGRLVTIRFDMTNDTGSSMSAIYGLPFDSDGHGGINVVWNNMDNSEFTGGYTNSGNVILVQSGTDSGWALTNGNRMIGFGTYFTTL